MFGSLVPASLGPIGVDLAADGIKLLQLRVTPSGADVIAATRIPPQAGDDEEIANVLRTAIAAGGFRGRRCVVSLPRCDVRSDLTELGTATPPSVTESRLAPLVVAGLRPVECVAAAVAIVRSLSLPPDTVRAVLDMGASGSTLLLVRGSTILATRAIPVGSADLDHAIDLRFGRNAKRAVRQGATTDDSHPAIAEVLRGRIEILAREVNLAIRSYGMTFHGPGPDRLILTGGAGIGKLVQATVRDHCRLATDTDRCDGLRLAPALERAGPPAIWRVAVGLSQWAALSTSRRPATRIGATAGGKAA